MMLPTKLRHELFERLSVVTMRYVRSISRSEAKGIVKEIYDMIAEDFFINGSLTSHSIVPELLAGVWVGGRESILVNDRLDMTTKEAIAALLSRLNDCSYCGDMLISLVHAAGKHDSAKKIYVEEDGSLEDKVLHRRLEWVKAVVSPDGDNIPNDAFTPEQIPEVVATIIAMGHINRVSHVTMDGSPVPQPMGMKGVKHAGLRSFGTQLKDTVRVSPIPGRSLYLLPKAELPKDMVWAKSHPRIADAFSRWAAVIEHEADKAVSLPVKELVRQSMQRWKGERMPLSRQWVEEETQSLSDGDRKIARLALLVAKASYQIDDAVVQAVLGKDGDQEKLLRVLAWGAFSGTRRVGELMHDRLNQNKTLELAG